MTDIYERVIDHKHCGDKGNHSPHDWHVYDGLRLTAVHQCPGSHTTGHTRVKLNNEQIGWLADHGPWPFVVNQGIVHWPDYSDGAVTSGLMAGRTHTAQAILGKFRLAKSSGEWGRA